MFSPMSFFKGIVAGSIFLLAACASVSSVEQPNDPDTIEIGDTESEATHGLESKSVENEPDWAGDIRRKQIPIPYDFGETLAWIRNNIFGPSDRHQELTDFIPQSITLNEITPVTSLGFFGDLMQLDGKRLHFAHDLKQFFADADYLIGNFEGTIASTNGGLMASLHTEAILEDLKSLMPPERFVLTNANNHTCDFGWDEFSKSYQLQKRHGFQVVGRKDEPSILLDGRINVASVTQWSNQPCTYLAEFTDIENAYDPTAFNVLSPHWGYEMQMYPGPEQIEKGQTLLGDWDMIVGHHTHAPQVITAYELKQSNKLLAYSLGDFCTYMNIDKYRHGIVVKAEVGPDSEGDWKVGKVEWRCSIIDQVDGETTRVRLNDRCELFPELAPASMDQAGHAR